jgi:anti-anti-sigma factor
MLQGNVPEAVVVVAGPFEGQAVERWGNLIAEAADLDPELLVVDLSMCPVLDAGAVAVLLGAHRAMISAGGRLRLRGPTGGVRRILRLARVDGVFEIVQGRPAEPVQA